MMNLLIENEANVNVVNKDGNTPLILALYRSKELKIFKTFARNRDFSIKKTFRSILRRVRKNCSIADWKTCRCQCCGTDRLYSTYACCKPRLKRLILSIWQIILELQKIVLYFYILWLNRFEGFGKLTQLLINSGAYINAADKDYNTALAFAAQRGIVHMIEISIELHEKNSQNCSFMVTIVIKVTTGSLKYSLITVLKWTL